MILVSSHFALPLACREQLIEHTHWRARTERSPGVQGGQPPLGELLAQLSLHRLGHVVVPSTNPAELMAHSFVAEDLVGVQFSHRRLVGVAQPVWR
jgi:hypothetical protein